MLQPEPELAARHSFIVQGRICGVCQSLTADGLQQVSSLRAPLARRLEALTRPFQPRADCAVGCMLLALLPCVFADGLVPWAWPASTGHT